jgi:DNA-binding NtrC family response regulator
MLAYMGRHIGAVKRLKEETMNPSAEKQCEPEPKGTVLVVDEDCEYLERVRRITQGMGYSVHACNSYAEGIRQLESGAFEFIVVGQGSRTFEGRCVVERAAKINRQLPVVVVARQLEMECYLEAMQLGAVDYVADPSVGAEIARLLRNHLSHHQS